MALPNVTNTIKDGAMGVAGADATGSFAAVGVAAIPSKGILTFVDAAAVEPAIGDGPLRDLVVGALSIAKTTVSVIALEGTVSGTKSAVTSGAANAGSGSVTVSGSPRNEYDVLVEITADGGLNEGAFRVTIDGLAGKIITIPDGGGLYVMPNTGLTLLFTAGEQGFKAGDTFSFSTTAPAATNGEVLEAVDRILEAKLNIEWIAVAGISAAPLWAALAVKAAGAEAVFQYLFFVAQARGKGAAETVDEWAGALTGSERGVTASTRLQVCALTDSYKKLCNGEYAAAYRKEKAAVILEDILGAAGISDTAITCPDVELARFSTRTLPCRQIIDLLIDALGGHGFAGLDYFFDAKDMFHFGTVNDTGMNEGEAYIFESAKNILKTGPLWIETLPAPIRHTQKVTVNGTEVLTVRTDVAISGKRSRLAMYFGEASPPTGGA
jgi:hypothetical protein